MIKNSLLSDPNSASHEATENGRRDFLRWVAVATGGVVVSQLGACGGGSGSSSASTALTEPAVLRSSNGLVSLDLVAEYSSQPITLGAADSSNTYPSTKTTVNTTLRRYKGSYPAPTLRVKAGDTIQIRLINRLPPSPSGQSSLAFLNHQNSTNLHFHGLHVSPKKVTVGGQEIYGDYVVDSPDQGVLPGAERLHKIEIPLNHPPGIFWYHPHLHGSTAAQVSGGMFGVIIVEGPTGQLFDPQIANERVIFVHKHNLTAAGRTDSLNDAAVSAPSGFLLNGVSQPTIVMRPGEVQIWHFINSSTFYQFNPVLDGHTLQLFARDGTPMPEGYRPIDSMTVTRFKNGNWDKHLQDWPGTFASPGSRISLFVKASDTAGTYYLRSALSPWTTLPNIPIYDEIVARIQVQGDPIQGAIPPAVSFTRHADFEPITADEVANNGGQTRNLVLGIFRLNSSSLPEPLPAGEEWALPPDEGGILSGSVFGTGVINSGITSKIYPFQSATGASIVSQTVDLGAVEEWTITTLDGFPHPFHMHVNDMYVVKINGQDLDKPYWADTLAIPPRGSITFRMRFKDYDGSFVWHCHVLDHEDLGMMQLVTIVNRL
jgi:FtsP/CotA-like multicopper oxidase with cupredoxin domain